MAQKFEKLFRKMSPEARKRVEESTLRNVIAAMGGKLELTAHFPSGDAHIVTFRPTERGTRKGERPSDTDPYIRRLRRGKRLARLSS